MTDHMTAPFLIVALTFGLRAQAQAPHDSLHDHTLHPTTMAEWDSVRIGQMHRGQADWHPFADKAEHAEPRARDSIVTLAEVLAGGALARDSGRAEESLKRCWLHGRVACRLELESQMVEDDRAKQAALDSVTVSNDTLHVRFHSMVVRMVDSLLQAAVSLQFSRDSVVTAELQSRLATSQGLLSQASAFIADLRWRQTVLALQMAAQAWAPPRRLPYIPEDVREAAIVGACIMTGRC